MRSRIAEESPRVGCRVSLEASNFPLESFGAASDRRADQLDRNDLSEEDPIGPIQWQVPDQLMHRSGRNLDCGSRIRGDRREDGGGPDPDSGCSHLTFGGDVLHISPQQKGLIPSMLLEATQTRLTLSMDHPCVCSGIHTAQLLITSGSCPLALFARMRRRSGLMPYADQLFRNGNYVC
ncbi:MAG TPA: hypothetical protein VIQ11_06585 [Mycobacterium sp.]